MGFLFSTEIEAPNYRVMFEATDSLSKENVLQQKRYDNLDMVVYSLALDVQRHSKQRQHKNATWRIDIAICILYCFVLVCLSVCLSLYLPVCRLIVRSDGWSFCLCACPTFRSTAGMSYFAPD